MAYLLPGGAVFQDPQNSQGFLLPGGSVFLGGPPQQIVVPLVTNTSTFYAATVVLGAVVLEPPLLVNGQTFFAHVLTLGAVPAAQIVYASADGGAVRGGRPAQASARLRPAQASTGARVAQESTAIRVN